MILRGIRLFMLLSVAQILASSDSIFKFPDGFLIGAASSSYQVEGAWNEYGKSESNWDYFIHKYPNWTLDGSSADVACDFYHRYPEDLKLAQEIGLQHYRFSLNMDRILPTGYPDYVNVEGVLHYHKVLDELEKRGLEPLVTVYHWSHPQRLEEEFGGWLNEKMAYVLADYARVVFKEFGSRVKYFVTLNEISHFCLSAYKTYEAPPSVNMSGRGEYICAHNMLKAHALMYQIYQTEFRSKYNGWLGVSIPITAFYSTKKNDKKSVDIAHEFNAGWIANPIYSKEGDYPAIMKERIAERSRLQGYKTSRLPKFSKKWIDLLRGSYDYFGLNYYLSSLVEPLPHSEILNWPDDDGLLKLKNPDWETAQSPWLQIYPKGFGDLLRRIKRMYGNPPVLVTENGVSDGNGTDDKMRTNYLYSHMREMMLAMKKDDCDVRAYTIWSYTDSFEWKEGFVPRFGLVQIDYVSQKRTLKNSVSWLRPILASRELRPPEGVYS